MAINLPERSSMGGCVWAFIAGLTVSAAALAALAAWHATHPSSPGPGHRGASAPCTKGSFVDFEDARFATNDWSDGQVGSTTFTIANYDVGNSAAGGPQAGGYRSVHLDFAGRGGLNVLHLQRAAVYNPACGRASYITAAYFLQNQGRPGTHQHFAFAVRQEGAIYTAGGQWVDATTWTPVSLPLLNEYDFTLFQGSGPANPNFSTTPLEFGYITANSCGSGTAPPCGEEQTRSAVGAWHVRVYK